MALALQKETNTAPFSTARSYTLPRNKSPRLRSTRRQFCIQACQGDITYRTTVLPANWGGFSRSRCSSPSREAYRRCTALREDSLSHCGCLSCHTSSLAPFPLGRRSHTPNAAEAQPPHTANTLSQCRAFGSDSQTSCRFCRSPVLFSTFSGRKKLPL